ncbi:secreted RxLR effector protein 161-like [Impatiens glandulifera]|uniref:secreted RxLR effector protein 161-like n=1 Tax=Impatiens glandulifera TaxID=253017 RepID=UPI001FB08A8B|nr:secreted RxLR effector protein 161-like [Impatiens glandulifera]
MIKGVKLNCKSSSTLTEPEKFRRLVGRLIYLNFTRPDIAFSVQQLSQFMHEPLQIHWEAALQVVRYLKGTPSLGLFYPSNSNKLLESFSDADWATCTDSRRSLTGYCIKYGDALISWKTKKQNTVSRSSAEAEYRSMTTTVCELKWISFLLKDLQIPVQLPIPLRCDNQAAIHIAENPVFHERTKHLDIDCHLVRDQFKQGFVLPQHVYSKVQQADIFTKPLEHTAFYSLRDKMNLRDLHLEEGILD